MNTASRIIFATRAHESVRVLTCGDVVTLQSHVLIDRMEPHLNEAGFVCDLEMRKPQVQGLICALANAIGMAVELREVSEAVAERTATEGLPR